MSAVNSGIPTAYSLLEEQEEFGRQVERQLKYRHVQLFMSRGELETVFGSTLETKYSGTSGQPSRDSAPHNGEACRFWKE